MATGIEWAEETLNTMTGCKRVDNGCTHCYAFELHDKRHAAYLRGESVPKQYARPFSEVQLLPERIDKPRHWRKPRKVFMDSMGDLFERRVPEDHIRKVFGMMADCPQHAFQILTRRPVRMASLLRRIQPEPLSNVWLGTSIPEQQWLSVRIPKLLETPAAIRWLSCEPLLEPLDLTPWLSELDWIVVGGLSGPNWRSSILDPVWVRSIRDQCAYADVPFFFKQWGGITPKAGGRTLDGRKWSEYPR